jgi:hypothetical protein
MLYRVYLAWSGFELTTSVVIGTDCIKYLDKIGISLFHFVYAMHEVQYNYKATGTSSENHKTVIQNIYR